MLFVALALLSQAIAFWQFAGAMRYPLHKRIADPGFIPGLTLLKPLKGCDAHTEECLRSWLTQKYAGPVQVLFGVAAESDPTVALVKKLLAENPGADAQLVICRESHGANAKVSTLIQLEPLIRHEIVIVSDADVWVPEDLLANVVAPLKDRDKGMATCFYMLANPSTLAMRCEAVAVNADFWSQVLQARNLKPLDFALGAVMAVRRERLESIGGFRSLADMLADDYQLGNRVARAGGRIALCPVVVECREPAQSWSRVLRHQLRWARTIRVCRPLSYFFSIIGNATLWAVLMAAVGRQPFFVALACAMIALRAIVALVLQSRLTRSRAHLWYDFLVPLKDLLHAVIWALAFFGNTVEWRGRKYRADKAGQLKPLTDG